MASSAHLLRRAAALRVGSPQSSSPKLMERPSSAWWRFSLHHWAGRSPLFLGSQQEGRERWVVRFAAVAIVSDEAEKDEQEGVFGSGRTGL
jgi:hypothetical protein